MPHPKAAAAGGKAKPKVSAPPADIQDTFAPPPTDFGDVNPQDPPGGYDDPLPPPSSARGKKNRKAADLPTAPPVEEEVAPEADEDYLEDVPLPEDDDPLEEPDAGHVMEAPPMPPEPDVDRSAASSDDGQNSEPPDVQVEVAQLQDMVNKCLKAALKGCPCTTIQNGERIPSRYFVDEALENVTVNASPGGTQLDITVPIAGIQDIFCVPEDGEAAFPSEVVKLVDEAEKDLLLMVVFQGAQGEYGKFCLLMDSREGRDGFMEAMRVLCVASRYNQDQRATTPQRPSAGAGAAQPAAAGAGRGSQAQAGKGASQENLAIPRQQVSVRFFMRCIGIKALQPTMPEQSPACPLPPLIKDGVVAYIGAYGYRPKDDMMWGTLSGEPNACIRPTLSIRVRQHFEAAKHTWYIVETTLRMDKAGCVARLDWLAPRRLAHLRVHLHDPIKDILGDAYARHFAGANFAHRLGLPGTTAQLHRWVNALADAINARRVPPLVVATVLNFLEAPNPAVGAAPGCGAEELAPFQATIPPKTSAR